MITKGIVLYVESLKFGWETRENVFFEDISRVNDWNGRDSECLSMINRLSTLNLSKAVTYSHTDQ